MYLSHNLPGDLIATSPPGESQLKKQDGNLHTSSRMLQLTDEQHEIIQAISTGRNILVAALAGTGMRERVRGL